MSEPLPPLAPDAPKYLTPIECRVYERHQCELPSACLPVAGKGRKVAKWAAVIRDISPRGVGLQVRRRFDLGVSLVVELPGGDGREPHVALGKVVHVGPQGDGSWILGCQFVGDLSEEEVRRLLPPLAQRCGPAEDQARGEPDPEHRAGE